MNVAIISEKQISVSWEGVPGVSGYLVQVRNYSGDVVWSNAMDYFGLSIDGVYTQRVAERIGETNGRPSLYLKGIKPI